MSANADLVTMETYIQQGKQYLKTSFSYMGQNVKKIYLGILGGGGGADDRTGPMLLSSYPRTHNYVHVK